MDCKVRLLFLFAMFLFCNLIIANNDYNEFKEYDYGINPDTVLHVSEIREIVFQSDIFNIYGNLYLPADSCSKYPLVIWVAGSGQVIEKCKTLKPRN